MSFGDRYATPERSSYYRRPENSRFLGTFLMALCFACVGFLIAIIWTGGWTADAIYAHIKFRTLTPQMLEGANIRVKPYDVAQEQIQTSLNSPTDNTAQLSIIKVNGRLTWTATRVPNGFWRGFSHGSDGIVTDGAESISAQCQRQHPRNNGGIRLEPRRQIRQELRMARPQDLLHLRHRRSSWGAHAAWPYAVAPYVSSFVVFGG